MQDIARDMKRREELRSYTDQDEITQNGHHEVHNHVTVNVPHQNQPDSKVDVDTTVEIGPLHVKGLPKWAVVAICALGAAVTALLAHIFR